MALFPYNLVLESVTWLSRRLNFPIRYNNGSKQCVTALKTDTIVTSLRVKNAKQLCSGVGLCPS